MTPARAARWRNAALASAAGLSLLALCVPLPGAAIDALHAAHVAVSAALVARVLRAGDARSLSSLPAAIALASVLRLSLEVSFVRAALSGRDVGAVSSTVADALASDGAGAALAAFALLAVAQLIVVARGAERAAEVSARFALDALPGAQLAVDADLRSGAIDAVTARTQRAALEADARLHGSLDGALKFVKGDAVIGLVAAAVNLLGGALSAVLRDGSTARDAFERYGALAAGQGVAARVPALAVATAAALVVTRSRWRDDAPGASAPTVEVTVPEGVDAGAVKAACESALSTLGIDAGVAVSRGAAASLSVRGVARSNCDGGDVVAWAAAATRAHAWRVIGIEEARALVGRVAREAPSLAHAAVSSSADLTLLADALGQLAREAVPLRPSRDLFEAFARAAPRERDAARLAEALRSALRERIAGAFVSGGSLRALRLHPVIEDALRDHAARRPWERPAADLADDVARAVERAAEGDPAVVVVTDASVRWYVRGAVEARLPDAAVLALQELPPGVSVETRGIAAPE